MASRNVTTRLRQRVWDASIALDISLHKPDCRSYQDSDSYLIQFPRLSYLAFLLPKLHTFFYSSRVYPDVSLTDAWFEYEGVPLKWHYPLGLLYDLYSGARPASAHDELAEQHNNAGAQGKEPLPWKLTIHFSNYPQDQLVKLDIHEKHLHDLFINNVKEADYLRTGTGKTVMFLSKEDSEQLWEGVKRHDFGLFNPINLKLLNPQGITFRHLPVRLYLPHAGSTKIEQLDADACTQGQKERYNERGASAGSVRIVQGLVPMSLSSRQQQTIGTALHNILPEVSGTRSPILAQAVLHGAILPLNASVEELIRTAAYPDGWLHIAFFML